LKKATILLEEWTVILIRACIGGDDLAETELETAEQRIHHSSAYPSRLLLPITP